MLVVLRLMRTSVKMLDLKVGQKGFDRQQPKLSRLEAYVICGEGKFGHDLYQRRGS